MQWVSLIISVLGIVALLLKEWFDRQRLKRIEEEQYQKYKAEMARMLQDALNKAQADSRTDSENAKKVWDQQEQHHKSLEDQIAAERKRLEGK